MEPFLSILGGLAIFGIIVIACVFVYVLLFRLRSGRSTKQPGIGIRKCPICGWQMESLAGMPHIILCKNPRCPNSRYDL